MATYSTVAINAKMQGLMAGMAAGFIILKSGATTLSTINLATPCGTVTGGVLTFTGDLYDMSAAGTGVADFAEVTDSVGQTMISGLTIGIPLSGADVVLSNGLGTTAISSGQIVALLSATITGA